MELPSPWCKASIYFHRSRGKAGSHLTEDHLPLLATSTVVILWKQGIFLYEITRIKVKTTVRKLQFSKQEARVNCSISQTYMSMRATESISIPFLCVHVSTQEVDPLPEKHLLTNGSRPRPRSMTIGKHSRRSSTHHVRWHNTCNMLLLHQYM